MTAEWRRSAGRLLLGSVVAGSVVSALAAVIGVQNCHELAGFGGEECRGLVRTLSINVGLLTGAVTAVMALFVAGLGRMTFQAEEDRRQRRLEALGGDADR